MDGNKNSRVPAGKPKKKESKRSPGEKRYSVNIIDIVLILMILSLVVMAVFAFAPNTNWTLNGAQSAKLEYTVEISGISKEMAAKIHVGDAVFEGDNRYMIGSVTNTEIDDCVEYVYNEESGRVEAVAYMDEGNSSSVRKTILVTITADAKYAEGNGYTVNGYRIAVNQDIRLCFPGFTGDGQCISVTVLETGAK